LATTGHASATGCRLLGERGGPMGDFDYTYPIIDSKVKRLGWV
jgi:hypothetical protein